MILDGSTDYAACVRDEIGQDQYAARMKFDLGFGSCRDVGTLRHQLRLQTCRIAGVQHIRFEGTPAYALAYSANGKRTLVVVAETCTATDPQVLFTEPF